MSNTLNWATKPGEFELINAIAERAVKLASQYGVGYPKRMALMDINAVHSNGNPLRLEELLTADDGNFGHDVFGIRRHLDRETGELRDCFVPRFSRPLGEGRASEPECPTCRDIREKYHGFGPSHNGSPNCQSGSIASGGQNAHCACDTCF